MSLIVVFEALLHQFSPSCGLPFEAADCPAVCGSGKLGVGTAWFLVNESLTLALVSLKEEKSLKDLPQKNYFYQNYKTITRLNLKSCGQNFEPFFVKPQQFSCSEGPPSLTREALKSSTRWSESLLTLNYFRWPCVTRSELSPDN